MPLAAPHREIVCAVDQVFFGVVIFYGLFAGVVLFVGVFWVRGIFLRQSVQGGMDNGLHMRPGAVRVDRLGVAPGMMKYLREIHKKLFRELIMNLKSMIGWQTVEKRRKPLGVAVVSFDLCIGQVNHALEVDGRGKNLRLSNLTKQITPYSFVLGPFKIVMILDAAGAMFA